MAKTVLLLGVAAVASVRYEELLVPRAGSCRDSSGVEPHRFAQWQTSQQACAQACSTVGGCSHYAWAAGQWCVVYGRGIAQPATGGNWQESAGSGDAPVTQTGDWENGYHCYAKADGEPCGGKSALLFAYFRTPQESLHFAYSCDGMSFSALNGNEPVLEATVGQKSVRDPYLQRGPDGKTFHLLSTNSWATREIIYWNSTDLVHWQGEALVPVMHSIEGTKVAWAPEWTYVKEKNSYFVFWSSETAETEKLGGGKRTYGSYTPDFQVWSEPKMFFEPGYTAIDADMVQVLQDDGSVLYNLFVKDERGHNALGAGDDVQGKFVRHATSVRPDGGFEATLGGQISPEFSEGPEVVHFAGEGRDPWLLYFDCFEDGHFGLSTSPDLSTWTEVQGCGSGGFVPGVSFPADSRHGSFLEISNVELQTLLEAFGGAKVLV